MIKHNWFLDWYCDGNRQHQKQLRPWIKFVGSLLIAIILVIIFIFNPVRFFPNGADLFYRYLKLFFSPVTVNHHYPSYNLWSLSAEFLMISLGNIFLGTISGWIAAMISAYFFTNRFFKNWLWNLGSWLIIGLRAFPVFVFLGIWQSGFHSFDVVVMVFFWFSWLWLHKYFVNIFQNVNLEQYQLYQKIGYARFSLFYQFIWQQIKHKSFLFLLFAIESNLRWISLLGSLGVIGLGTLIYQPIADAAKNFEEVFIPFLFLFLSLLFFEIVLNFYTKNNSSKTKITNWHPQQMAQRFYYGDKFKLLIFGLMFGISIYSLTQLNFHSPANAQMLGYLEGLFNVKWYLFTTDQLIDNPFYLFFQVLLQTITIFCWAIFFGIIWGLLASPKIVNKFIAKFFAGFNLLNRSLPTILLFYLFNPIFDTSQATVIMILIFSTSFNFAKKINGMIYKITDASLQYYQLLSYSKLWILQQHFWPRLKQEFWSFSKFEFELILRDVVIFGIFGASLFGQKFISFATRNPEAFNVYLWTFWLGIIFLEIITNLKLNQLFTKITQITLVKNFVNKTAKS
ncbi:phosphonate transport system permease protein [Mycoplasmoides fastidiosum]|uniref:Phosphonate transport system permease protein n=1 Tax=Mycoplasmoides fastidiosum TaxID=92758 RepID=A0ABU0LZD7_9BACT|nr:hypothetical protein [Mycoplasmoides fastidiosum]MDQ0514076.1 phosphonate transport system permease protein [Mycoplasmoides fastidiosum]UUD37514.1 hypothetical protein NPA10_03010 [Mycoplasmoides fastidiosum]